MSLLISKKFTGLPYDMVLKDGLVRKSAGQETTDFTFGVPSSVDSVEQLFKVFTHEKVEQVPEEYVKSFGECGYKGEVPWSYVIPKHVYLPLLKRQLGQISDAYSAVQESSYASLFRESNELFSFLKSSRIDKQLADRFLQDGDNHVLKSIAGSCNDKGIIPVPVYDRSSTKTGRLVVKQGPQILTMKKEHRTIFRPVNPLNRIYEIDFRSLEPRVAANIAEQDCGADVYSSFTEASGLNVSRDVAKLAVLCALYGAGKYRLESVLSKGSSNVSARALLSSVREYFAVNKMAKSLLKEAESGRITNCFGRPIEVDDRRDTMLVNNFLQSSAVDVSLLGFLDFCKRFDYVRPLFIIHDALMFECSPEHLGAVREYVDNGFAIQKLGNFPLKLTELS